MNTLRAIARKYMERAERISLKHADMRTFVNPEYHAVIEAYRRSAALVMALVD